VYIGDMSLVVLDDRILVEGVLNAAHLVNKSAHCQVAEPIRDSRMTARHLRHLHNVIVLHQPF